MLKTPLQMSPRLLALYHEDLSERGPAKLRCAFEFTEPSRVVRNVSY